VRGHEAEALVEAVGVSAAFVGGELDEHAPPVSRHHDRPLDHPRADAAVAGSLVHPDGLDLRPPRPAPRQAGDEAQLHRADDPAAAVYGDDEQVPRIGRDRVERGPVGRQLVRRLALDAQLVGGEQCHDLGQVVGRRLPERDGAAGHLERRKIPHGDDPAGFAL
jgi:hypothetical protein